MTILSVGAQVQIAPNSSFNGTSVCYGIKRLVLSAYLNIILIVDMGSRFPSSTV
jgi:hypothetical protein